MTSTTSNLISQFSAQLSYSEPLTSVATSINIPLTKITSVLGKAISEQSVNISKLATITDTSVSQSIEERVLLAQATINYYSVLKDIATATSVPAALYTQAAQASAAMETMYSELAFYDGNLPSLGGNIALVIVFAIILTLQVCFGVFFRSKYFLIFWSIGLSLEVLGYAGRVWLHFNIFSLNAYILQTICIALGPSVLLTGLFYLFAQVVHVYGEQYSSLKPSTYLYTFMAIDTIAGALQGAGAGVAAGSTSNYQMGLDLMTAGMAVQLFAIVVLQFLWFYFLSKIFTAYKSEGDVAFNPEFASVREKGFFAQARLLGGTSIAMILFLVRTCYRLAEVSSGWYSKLVIDEIYFMLLEALMISLACAIMTICHPGFLIGRYDDVKVDFKYHGILGLLLKSITSHNEFVQEKVQVFAKV